MANNSQVETVHSGADKAKLAAAILFAVGAFVAHFILTGQNVESWVQWLALFALLALAAGCFFISSWGKEFIGYCRDSVKEVKKVVWPTRKEAAQMTLAVFAFVSVMAIFLWLVDKLLEWGIFGILLQWK